MYLDTKEFLAIALYLWVVFAMLELHKSVILGEHHINTTYHGFALFNALALAKVILFTRRMRLADFVHHVPLIYPTLLKSAAFTLVLACFKILKGAALGWYRGLSFSQSIADLGGGTYEGILCVAAIVFVVLIPFFAFTELQIVVGEGKLMQVFFSRHQSLDLTEPRP